MNPAGWNEFLIAHPHALLVVLDSHENFIETQRCSVESCRTLMKHDSALFERWRSYNAELQDRRAAIRRRQQEVQMLPNDASSDWSILRSQFDPAVMLAQLNEIDETLQTLAEIATGAVSAYVAEAKVRAAGTAYAGQTIGKVALPPLEELVRVKYVSELYSECASQLSAAALQITNFRRAHIRAS